MRRLRQFTASLGDLRLPKAERQAAKAERAEEARIRTERDHVRHAETRAAAAEAERRRYGGGGAGGYGGGPGM